MIEKIMKFFNENHWQAITVAIVMSLCYWFYGCQSKVASVNDPKLMVTRTELQGEINAYLAIAESRMTTLDEKDALRKAILDNAALFAQSGQWNTLGAINSVISLLAIGSAVDSRNKLSKVKKA